ncbi:MAG: NYN domain-containing protein [Anaerolineae bacterium]
MIDAENQADLDVRDLMSCLDRFRLVERHAHADWDNPRLNGVATRLGMAGFRLHEVCSGPWPGAYKDASDIAMAEHMRRLAARPDIGVFVVVSGDAFFTDEVRALQEQGKWVIVAANPCHVSRRLCRTADDYLPIGRWGKVLRTLSYLEHGAGRWSRDQVVPISDIERNHLKKLIDRNLIVWRRPQSPGQRLAHESY